MLAIYSTVGELLECVYRHMNHVRLTFIVNYLIKLERTQWSTNSQLKLIPLDSITYRILW